jgi:hypothetical protein
MLRCQSYLHDLIRTRNLRYDLYLYDDVARWNRRQRKLAARQKADHDDVSKAKRQWRSKSPGTARLN